MSPRHKQFAIRFLILPCLLLSSNLSGYADCKTNYTQATELLDNALLKTRDPKASQSADPDTFETQFHASVTQLRQEKCLPELMSLIQRIQSERQKQPQLEKPAKPVPIID